MIKYHTALLITTSVSVLMFHLATAQNSPPYGGSGVGRPLTSFSDALRERGIDTSQPSLIAALSNSDPNVRSIAAHQLLADQDYLAKPAIEKALSTETDNRAKIGMASALVGFGDPVGARTLESMCTDASLPMDVTVSVIQELGVVQYSQPKLVSTGKCADVVLAALEHASEGRQRTALVSLLPVMYHDVSKEKLDRMVAIAQTLLEDMQASTRMQASLALTNMGSTASIGLIRNAMDRETDPNVRHSTSTISTNY